MMDNNNKFNYLHVCEEFCKNNSAAKTRQLPRHLIRYNRYRTSTRRGVRMVEAFLARQVLWQQAGGSGCVWEGAKQEGTWAVDVGGEG
jgi:hypothetical protein